MGEVMGKVKRLGEEPRETAPGEYSHMYSMHPVYRPEERLGSLLNGFIEKHRSVTDVPHIFCTIQQKKGEYQCR
jgi:hypothetical protein